MKKLLYISLTLNLIGIIAILLAVQKLGGWQFILYRLNNQGLAGHYEHRKKLYEVLPNSSGKIVFLGDSLTEQCEWDELFENDNIINRGIAGDQTQGILDRLDLVLKLAPQQLFLMIGVNDLLFHSPEKIIDNYQKIVNQIQQKSSSTQLILQSTLPINNNVRNITIANADLQKINVGIEKIAKSAQVEFVNLYPHFTNRNGDLDKKYTADGIHLNGEGYLNWRKQIETLIAE